MNSPIIHNNFNELLNSAIKYQNSGQLQDAESIYVELSKYQPDNSQVLFLLGSLYGQMGKYENCINTLNQSLEINPTQINAYNNLAIAYEFNNQPDLAIQSYSKALEISPDSENALLNKATLLGQLNRRNEAAHVYKQALIYHPDNPKVLSNYSALLQLDDETVHAEALVRKALKISPNYPQALSNLGNLLIKTEKFTESEQCLMKAITLSPSYAEAHINLGFLYHNTAKFDEALACFNKAISLEPESDTGHWYRSFTLLLTGQFKTAWNDYEYGLNNGERIVTNYSFIPYNPNTIGDNELLITAEQGVGDQVMFSSCLFDVLKLTNKIVLECDKRLVPLFKRSFPEIKIIYRNQFNNTSITNEFPEIQQKISIGSLPGLFRTSKNAFPQNAPYLKVNINNLNKWKERYKLLGNKLNVGISWQGGVKVDHEKRSMPLDAWKNILNCDCNFINLQYGDHSKEITEIREKYGVTIHDWNDSDSLKNLDDFSAQIAALDLVISVGNTNVHLAGSLNIPTWCLIPQVPSWRWLTSGEQCLWYPSVKMYRQKRIHEWEQILATVKIDLKKTIEHKCND